MPERGAFRIKDNGHVRGFCVPEEFEEHSGKPEDGVRWKTPGA